MSYMPLATLTRRRPTQYPIYEILCLSYNLFFFWEVVREKTPSIIQSALACVCVGVRSAEDCGPNRNCFAAVKRERNASKPPLEEFLSRSLGT